MPSRASTSLLRSYCKSYSIHGIATCQCPLGLVPHCYGATSRVYYEIFSAVSMPSRASTSLLREQYSVSLEESMVCQCPLGLIPHFY